jgi:hypothetical protein
MTQFGVRASAECPLNRLVQCRIRLKMSQIPPAHGTSLIMFLRVEEF